MKNVGTCVVIGVVVSSSAHLLFGSPCSVYCIHFYNQFMLLTKHVM